MTETQIVRKLRRQLRQEVEENDFLLNAQETEEERYDLDDLARLELQITAGESKARIAQLTKDNENLSHSRGKHSKARRDLLRANKKLVDDNSQLVDDNSQLTQTNDELLRSKEDFSEDNRQLVQNNGQLVQSNDELSKSNQALSESRQKLTDKTGRLAQVNRGLYVQYRELHEYTRGEVQGKIEWAESYRNIFNYTRGVVEAQTELVNSQQNLVSSIETTETLLASCLMALAPDSQLPSPPDSVDERMRYIFAGIVALGTAFQNARETFLSTPIVTETPGTSLDAPIVTATPGTPLDAPAMTETPSSSSETTEFSTPNARVSRAGPPQISNIALPGPSQQVVSSFDLRSSVIVWAVRQNSGRSSRFMFKLEALISYLARESRNIRSIIRRVRTAPLIGRVIIPSFHHENYTASEAKAQADHVGDDMNVDEAQADHVGDDMTVDQAQADHVDDDMTVDQAQADHVDDDMNVDEAQADDADDDMNVDEAQADDADDGMNIENSGPTQPAQVSEPKQSEAHAENGMDIDSASESRQPDQASGPKEPEAQAGHADIGMNIEPVNGFATATPFSFNSNSVAMNPPAVGPSFHNNPTSFDFASTAGAEKGPTFGIGSFPELNNFGRPVRKAKAASKTSSKSFFQPPPVVNLSNFGQKLPEFPFAKAQVPAVAASGFIGGTAPIQPSSAVNLSKSEQQKLPDFSFAKNHIPVAAASSSIGGTAPIQPSFPAVKFSDFGGQKFPDFSFEKANIPAVTASSSFGGTAPMDLDFAKTAAAAGGFNFGSNSTLEKPVEKPAEKPVASAQSAARPNTRAGFIEGLIEKNEEIKQKNVAIDIEVSLEQLGIDTKGLKRSQIRLVVSKA